MPTVSFLLSVYQGEKPEFLRQSLGSILNQTRPSDEVVLVEDGPLGDDLRDVIEDFRTCLPLCSVVLGQNRGLAAALNAGLRVASGELVARLDTDDLALPSRIAAQLDFIAATGADVVGGFAVEINSDNVEGRLRKVPTSHRAILAGLWANPFIHPSVMYRRDKILVLGGYNESIRRAQDYELWFRCAKAGLNFGNIDQPIIQYRFVEGTLRRSSPSEKLKRGLFGYRASRDLGLPFWKQVSCFAPFARSLLPGTVQKPVYRLMQHFRP